MELIGTQGHGVQASTTKIASPSLAGTSADRREWGRLAGMADLDDPKAALHHYLRANRDDLIWKLDGLSEREARLPRTATGTNLLGIVKHCLNVEAGYFGPTFGREFPTPEELVPDHALDEDPQADWYAREDETKDGLIDLYRRVGMFADQTIEQLPLDAPGRVPWWQPGRQAVTLQTIIIHVTSDIARHAGHADILREQHDNAIGWRRDATSIPDEYDWPGYVAKLTKLADRFG
jgi:uncharacterized damage-inducible protein DinB